MLKKRYILGIFLITPIITKAADIDLYLSIFNTFSGNISITGANSFERGGTTFTNTTTPSIQISSDTGSQYTITGDIQSIISGSQLQPYTIQTTIPLTKTNQINQIFPIFQKGSEPLVIQPIKIFVDTQAPSQPIITSPIQNSSRNGPTIVSRTPSLDNGAGIREYIILISTNQTFSTTIYYQTTPNNEYYLDSSSLTQGKLYLKILVKDQVANINESQTITICNKCNTENNNGNSNGGGGGGGGSYIPAQEPSKIQRITIIENLEELQKTTPKEEPKIGFFSNIFYSDELLDAYKYAYSLGITTMPSAYQASLKGKLIRKDLAKMISEYAIKVAKRIPDNTLVCNFEDTKEETLETKYYTKLACKLGLMGRHADGKSKQDNFNPYEEVNRAQFGTVLSRTIFGETNNIQSGENLERYQKHLGALKDKNIMQKIDTPRSQELRGRVMLTMMRADPNYQKPTK